VGAGRPLRRRPRVARYEPRFSHLLDDVVERLATATVRFGLAHSRRITDHSLQTQCNRSPVYLLRMVGRAHLDWYTMADLGSTDAVNQAFVSSFTEEMMAEAMTVMDWSAPKDQVQLIVHLGGMPQE